MDDEQKPPRGPRGLAASPGEVEEVYARLEEGEILEALETALALESAFPEDGDVALAHAAAAYQAGFSNECLTATRRAKELGCESPSLQRFYEASALFRLWESEEAAVLVRELLEENPDFPEAWYLSAQIRELQGDEIGARRGYQEADRLAPEAFPRPTRISSAALDQVIEEALKNLPEPFDDALSEVTIVIRDLPDWEMAQPESPDEEPFPPDLLGLFVGTDRLEKSRIRLRRSSPGVIFLFQTQPRTRLPRPPASVDEIQHHAVARAGALPRFRGRGHGRARPRVAPFALPAISSRISGDLS